MAETAFRLRLVTPSASLLDEPVSYVTLPAYDGLMGFQPGRAPVVVRLGLGEMTVRFSKATHGGGDRRYLIDRGFAQMAGDELIVLAESAIPAEQLTASEAEAELTAASAPARRAEGESPLDAVDRRRHASDRARLKLRMARQIRGGRGI